MRDERGGAREERGRVAQAAAHVAPSLLQLGAVLEELDDVGGLLLHVPRLDEVGARERLERLDVRLHVDRLLERAVGPVQQHRLQDHPAKES